MRRFGLIGYPLSHSFSQGYFTRKFEEEEMQDCQYENFPIEQIDALPALFSSHPDLEGLNVTIPYKEQVMAYLDEASAEVQAIGACNCIHVSHGRRVGYNTDVIGFGETFLPALQPHHQHALVLGTGGAAKAVAWVLHNREIPFAFVSRRPGPGQLTYEDLNEAMMQQYSIIINSTPLGMFPKVEACPPLPYEFLSPAHYLFDLVYNPEETLFLKKGREQGALIRNGADMLRIQAEAAWDIWNR